MHVHFVAVEVGVVGRCYREVHAERRPRQHLDSMAHHGHFVERRLPIEDDYVSVAHVSLNSVARLKVEVGDARMVAEIYARAVLADYIFCARISRVAAANELLKSENVRTSAAIKKNKFAGRSLLVNVERRHDFRKREILCDRSWHADRIDGQIGVGRDDGARREVDSLAHEIAANATLFALQPLLDRL